MKTLYEQCGGVLPSVILTDRCLAAINAASTLFPSPATTLLCVWHANKAVLARCQPAFQIAELWREFYSYWFSILSSSTEEIYNKRLKEFQEKYASKYPEQVNYIKSIWLIPFKEKLVSAWVDQSPHFGNTTTSRVEGIYALLKSYLRRSTFDLFEAWKAIWLALVNQLSELQSNQAKQQIRTPLELDKTLYRAVQGWVSHEALRKVEEQRRLRERDPPPSSTCTGTFTRVYELPCLHILDMRQGSALLLEDFHSHWYLIRDGAPQLLLEPRQRIELRQRIEPIQIQSNIPRSSTKRESSQFEVVESQARQAPTCSKCRTVGYRMGAKACPLRYSNVL